MKKTISIKENVMYGLALNGGQSLLRSLNISLGNFTVDIHYIYLNSWIGALHPFFIACNVLCSIT